MLRMDDGHHQQQLEALRFRLGRWIPSAEGPHKRPKPEPLNTPGGRIDFSEFPQDFRDHMLLDSRAAEILTLAATESQQFFERHGIREWDALQSSFIALACAQMPGVMQRYITRDFPVPLEQFRNAIRSPFEGFGNPLHFGEPWKVRFFGQSYDGLLAAYTLMKEQNTPSITTDQIMFGLVQEGNYHGLSDDFTHADINPLRVKALVEREARQYR